MKLTDLRPNKARTASPKRVGRGHAAGQGKTCGRKPKPTLRRKVVRTATPAVTDPIADMLTRIRNAAMAKHVDVNIPVSKMKMEIASILHREGYIRGFQLVDRGRILRIRLKYDATRRPVINGLKRVSKPGRRVYAGHENMPRVLGGMGVAIVSTSKGIITGREAQREGVGGEVVGIVW